MLTIAQIKDYAIGRSALGGYRSEDVDVFREEVLETCEKLFKDNQDLIQKLQVLAAKIEEYRSESDQIRDVMVSARKSTKELIDAATAEAEQITREAREQSQQILQEANRQADEIIGSTTGRIELEKQALATLRSEVSGFKARIISIYREHIELISSLPEEEEIEAQAREEGMAGDMPAVDSAAVPAQESGFSDLNDLNNESY